MNVPKWLIKGWIWSLGFIYLLDLPYLNTKVQLPEMAVLLLLGFWAISPSGSLLKTVKHPTPFFQRYYAFEGAVLIFLSIALLSTFFHPTKASFLENAGYGYLFLTSLLVQWIANKIKDPLVFFQQSFIQLGMLLALINMGIGALYYLGIDVVSAVVEVKNIPPLGIFPRILGFMPGVNLLADLMGLCWLMTVSAEVPRGKYGRSLLILAGLILTCSKSLLLLLPLGLYIGLKNNKTTGRTGVYGSQALVLMAALVYLFLTHILVQPRSSAMDSKDLAAETYLTGNILAQTDGLVFWETSYLRLKQMHLLAAVRNPILGLGPGNFNRFLDKARAEGRFPDHLPSYDPHSTLSGSLAELGLLGFLAILFLGWVVFRMIRKGWSGKGNPAFYTAIGCYFIFMGIETFTTDILNFRHVWICLGLLAWDYKRMIDASN